MIFFWFGAKRTKIKKNPDVNTLRSILELKWHLTGLQHCFDFLILNELSIYLETLVKKKE